MEIKLSNSSDHKDDFQAKIGKTFLGLTMVFTAKQYSSIYPVATRCGVFAKTDIQVLLNEGARKEDIAASVFQALVNQTISGLACGKSIKGHVAFLGGPLWFLSELRQKFKETLKLNDSQVLFPELAAIGAALAPGSNNAIRLPGMIKRLKDLDKSHHHEFYRLQPLFSDENDLNNFRKRHDAHRVNRRNLESFAGECFLGLDAGSTTTKVALIDENGSLLYSSYSNNARSSLKFAVSILKDLYSRLPAAAKIANAAGQQDMVKDC